MTVENITVLARIRAKNGMEEKIKQPCMALIEPTRSEAGCISYDFHTNAEDKSSFMFYENWVSTEALDEHLQRPHLKAFIAKAQGLLAEPMDITIWKKLS